MTWGRASVFPAIRAFGNDSRVVHIAGKRGVLLPSVGQCGFALRLSQLMSLRKSGWVLDFQSLWISDSSCRSLNQFYYCSCLHGGRFPSGHVSGEVTADDVPCSRALSWHKGPEQQVAMCWAALQLCKVANSFDHYNAWTGKGWRGECG